MKRALLPLLAVVCLAGCVTAGSTWISSSQFNYRHYEHSEVTLLPIVASPLVTDTRLNTTVIAKIVASELSTLELYNVKTPNNVKTTTGDNVEFPYTPQRLATLGRALATEVALGVNITRMDVRPLSSEWFITGNIIFVDVEKPERYWTLAKTWRFSGEPGSSPRMKQQLRDSLRADFMNVRAALKRSRTSSLLGRDTVFVDAGPILSLDAADWTLTSDAKTARGKVSIADPGSYEQGVTQLQIDYAAIDDGGITELVLENPAAAFRTSVLVGKDETGKPPIYLADRVLVPISPGLNNIMLSATNKNNQTVTRNLEFSSEPSAGVQMRELILISATEFHQLPKTALLTQTQEIMSDLESHQGVTLRGGRALAFAGENATRERILLTAANQWAQPRSNTRRELALLGRAEMVDGEPFIYLYNSDVRYPVVGALSLTELRQLLSMGVSKATLELCTRESQAVPLRDFYMSALGPKVTVTVTPSCEQPLGQKLLEIARALREPPSEAEITVSDGSE